MPALYDVKVYIAAEQLQLIDFLPCPLWIPRKEVRWQYKEGRGRECDDRYVCSRVRAAIPCGERGEERASGSK